jgi:hypothetical protein
VVIGVGGSGRKRGGEGEAIEFKRENEVWNGKTDEEVSRGA